jgi:predicted molibdopterin-dependent oxidoreductase YjgC
MPITLTVNGNKVTVPDGASVLDAVNASNTYLSQLCKDPDMKPIGACRTCLVQIEGQRGFPASCSTPARDGMVVNTETPEVRRIRRVVLELTLAMVHPPASPPRAGEGVGGEVFHDLSVAAAHHGITAARWAPRPREPADTSSPVFVIDMSACIMCQRCAQGCQDGHQFIGAIGAIGTGTRARIATFDDRPLIQSVCTTCGTCLSVCPTGAIHTKEQPTLPMSTLATEEETRRR